jgi:hypothetical protein
MAGVLFFIYFMFFNVPFDAPIPMIKLIESMSHRENYAFARIEQMLVAIANEEYKHEACYPCSVPSDSILHCNHAQTMTIGHSPGFGVFMEDV